MSTCWPDAPWFLFYFLLLSAVELAERWRSPDPNLQVGQSHSCSKSYFDLPFKEMREKEELGSESKSVWLHQSSDVVENTVQGRVSTACRFSWEMEEKYFISSSITFWFRSTGVWQREMGMQQSHDQWLSSHKHTHCWTNNLAIVEMHSRCAVDAYCGPYSKAGAGNPSFLLFSPLFFWLVATSDSGEFISALPLYSLILMEHVKRMMQMFFKCYTLLSVVGRQGWAFRLCLLHSNSPCWRSI